tara:strand:- start:33 stop:395 length:363 start_codon:yes stop_codon:yes gene_type:complete
MFEYKCVVTRVVDGDTVDVDIDLGFGVWLKKQRVRLMGVNAPESRTRDLEEKKRGLAAKEFVKAFCPEGQVVKLRSHDRGKFGRILGEIIVFDSKLDQESTINQMLIREGHAVEYHGGKR